MNTNKLNTILVIVLFTAVFMLSGFNKPQTEYFPAPLAAPVLCFYSNLSASGLYDNGEAASNASQEIIGQIESLCVARGAEKTSTNHIRTAAESLLNDRVLSGQLKVYELFFYYRDLQNFAVILRGEFDRQKLVATLGDDKVVSGENVAFARLRSPLDEKQLIYLQFAADEILVCPDNISGNLSAQLEARHNLLGNDFAAFTKMIKVRPALAAETDLFALQSDFTNDVPAWLKSLCHARLIVSSQMTKLQLFVPDADERAQLLLQVEGMIGDLRGYAGNLVDFAANPSGNSIFIEAEADKELERLFSSRSFAFFAHFFVRAQKSQILVSLREADADDK